MASVTRGARLLVAGRVVGKQDQRSLQRGVGTLFTVRRQQPGLWTASGTTDGVASTKKSSLFATTQIASFSSSAAAPPPPASDAAKLPPTYEVTQESFQKEVLQAKGLILLDAYANWCGPCKQLAPILEKIAKESNGKVRIAKLDTDKYPKLAAGLDVKSLPTVFAILNGGLLDRKIGMDSEENTKKWIAGLITKSESMAANPAAAAAGDSQEKPPSALELLDDVLIASESKDPETVLSTVDVFKELSKVSAAEIAKQDKSPNAPKDGKPTEVHRRRSVAIHAMAYVGLARCAMAAKQPEQARAILKLLDVKEFANEVQNNQFVAKGIAQIKLALDAPSSDEVDQLANFVKNNPKDVEARVKLATALQASGKVEQAIAECLAVLKQQRGNEKAKTLILQIFTALGPDSKVAQQGRKALSSLLLL